MNHPWNTPKEYKQMVKLIAWASGSMEEAENTSPEMKQAYKDMALMCEQYIKIFNQKQGK